MNTNAPESALLTSGSGELLTYHQKKSTTFCDTYIFEPETPREQPCGKLFVLIEIEENNKKASQIAEAIATIAQHEYYKNQHPGVAANFEAALAKVNDVLSEIAQHGEISWVGKVNAIIAAHFDHHLVLSQTGKAKAFLFRDHEFMEIGEETDNAKQDAVRIFESIASGDVLPHDHVILSTKTLLNSLSLQRIDEFLSENPVLTAIRLIQGSIDANVPTPSCAVFLKIDTAKAIEIDAAKDNRYADLTPEELSTASPAKKIQNLYDDIRSRSSTVKAVETTKKIGRGFAVAGQFASHLSKNVFESIRGSKKKDETPEKQIIQKPAEKPQEQKSTGDYGVLQVEEGVVKKKPRFDIRHLPKNIFYKIKDLPVTLKNMPRTSQVLLTTSASLLLVFIVSIGIFSTKKNSDAKSAAIKKTLDTAQEKVNSASASLIYNDVNGALTLLSEADSLNKQVLGTSQYNAEAAALQDKINQEKNRVAHINDVAGVVKLVDIGGTATTKLTGLHKDGNTLYVGRTDNNTIYAVNTTAKTADSTSTGSTGLSAFVRGTDFPLDNSILFITSANELASFSTKDKSVAKLNVALSSAPKDLAAYGTKNVYALLSEQNQILKLTKSFGGFSKPSDWLKGTNDLSGAVSLAIDGNVYVLNTNGTIQKFLKGAKVDFAQASLSKPLAKATKIFTSDTTDNIYVLDGSQKRIVVLDKNGTFVKDLISDSFQDANDFLIDEASKTGFVTVGTRVFTFPLVLK